MKTPAEVCTRPLSRGRIKLLLLCTLILASGAMGTDIILDNGDPGTTFTGTWAASGADGAYGADSLWARDGAAYTWKAELPDGTYEVFMWWTEFASRSSAVPVSVEHDAGTEQLTVDQQVGGGQWNSLGTYTFSGSGAVTLVAEGDYPVSTCADAVRFVRVDAPPADAIVIIDNRDAATSPAGNWPVSDGENPYGADAVYSRTAGHAFSWRFTAPSTGHFEVSMWWTEFSSRSNAAPVEIENADGTAMVTVNQLTDGGRWNVLGSYPFEAGKTYRVTIRTLNDNTTVCADAVRFEPTSAPAETIIDNSDAAVDVVGSWAVSDGENAYGPDAVCSGTFGHAFSWLFTPSANGHYEAAMWWAESSSNSDAAPVEVEHRLGSSRVTVNQMADGGKWNVLGVYQFEAGKTYRVTLRTPSDGSSVCADAVRFVRVSAPPIKADFTIESIDGDPLKVQFRDLSTSDNSITAWSWDFGNNGQIDSTEQNPVHEFTEPGPHSVALTVESLSGTDTVVKENLIAADVPITSAAAYEIILDNGRSGTSSTGTWAASDGPSPYGGSSLWARNTASYSWRVVPQQTGSYDVYMWWTVVPSRGTAIPVSVQHANGTANLTVNQTANGGRWNLLGTGTMNAGTAYTITLRTMGGSPTACADAVRLVLRSSSSGSSGQPVAAITRAEPNPAARGETVYFSGTGTGGTISAYQWYSSLDGVISTQASFNTSTLSAGTHNIRFRVKDSRGVISDPASVNLTVTSSTASSSSSENIYVCVGYGTERMNTQLESMLKSIGAKLSSGVWTYTRAGKTYRIYNVTSVAGMKSAMRTSGAHILYYGHSNYGLGQMFASSAEMTAQKITNFYYVDDDRILNCSTPTVAVNIMGMIRDQAYPNWSPVFKNGSSAIAPYNFSDPRGAPPYNYYLTYRVAGDSTYYKIDSPRNSALIRFPASGRPAWYSSSGAVPNPNNTDHRKYFITNSSATTSSSSLFNATGGWAASTSVSGYYGSNYLWISAASGGSARATWNTSANSSTGYNVFARWAASSGRSSSVPYTVTHNSGTTTVRVDQRTNGARWNNLGRFSLSSGKTYPVYVTNNGPSGAVIADAVMVSHASNPPYVLQSDFYATTRSGSAPLTVTFYSLCTGQADIKAWNWGDGTSTSASGTTFSKTYTKPGTYTVSLTARGAGNSHTVTKTGYIVVGSTAAPRVEFSATGREGTLSRTVAFTNRTNGSIRSVLWNFGNGVTSTVNNPTYTYTQPGNYTVSLRVTFTNGSTQTVTKPNFVRARYYERIFDNTTAASTSYHYGTRTILMRGPIEVSPSEMKYSRLFLLSCSSGEYYLQTMGRGVVFYSLDTTEVGPGPGFSLYLKAYLEGRSNAQILSVLLNKGKFDYYDFTKRPQNQ